MGPPVVLVDAEYRGKTGEGLLRHPSYQGVREDLMDVAPPPPRRASGRRTSRPASGATVS
jgi:hypothetical protein